MKTDHQNKVIIGIDIGGTKIKVGAVAENGVVVGVPVTVATRAADPQGVIVERICATITAVMEQNCLNKEAIVGVGMGVTGPLDVKNGKILQCPNLPTMDFFPLRDAVAQFSGLHVVMNNDANAMILGESIWGAGSGHETIVGVTLGTGFGCAVVLRQKLVMGATETAGEIWTSPYQSGIIEDVVSGSGISKIYRELTGTNASAAEIAQYARQGDAQAMVTWQRFGKAVAFALSWMVNLIDPDIVLMGGSITHAMDLFMPTLESEFRKYICPVPAEKTRILKAQLGDNAGFIGAAALVCEQLKKQ
jgi:glucokinase